MDRSCKRASVAVCAVLGTLVASAAGAAVDLTGKWRFSGGTPAELVDVAQTGSTATFTYLGATFTVTLSPNGSYSGSAPAGPNPCPIFLEGRVLPSGKTLDGRLTAGPPPSCTGVPFIAGIMARRCTCSDGNTTDGDGCSATCQVEPCFTCAGDPSVCTPSSNGAPCDDGRDCTTAETCSAGTCAGGLPVVPCVDMTGLWSLHSFLPGFGYSYDDTATILQRGGDLFFDGGAPDFVGSIDAATGSFDVRRVPNDYFCSFESFNGTVTPDGNFLSGMGTVTASTLHCVQFSTQVTGYRGICGNGVREGTEACDDGNQTPGDGCEADCTLTIVTTTSSTSSSTSTSTSSSTSTTLRPIPTRSLTLKDKSIPPPDPSRRSVAFKSDTRPPLAPPESRILPPASGSPGDPRIGGATLTVYNSNPAPGSPTDVVSVTLLATNWEALKSASPGYRYRGPDPENGPIKRVVLKSDSLSVRGGKSGWGYTLDESAQGSIAVRLVLGDGTGWCADGPAKSSGNPPSTARTDRQDKFVATPKTPAPSSCPPLP